MNKLDNRCIFNINDFVNGTPKQIYKSVLNELINNEDILKCDFCNSKIVSALLYNHDCCDNENIYDAKIRKLVSLVKVPNNLSLQEQVKYKLIKQNEIYCKYSLPVNPSYLGYNLEEKQCNMCFSIYCSSCGNKKYCKKCKKRKPKKPSTSKN